MMPFTSQIFSVFISLLQKLDANALAPLKPHLNKTLCFDIENFCVIYLQITDSGLTLIDKPEHVDATFAGPLRSFMTTLFGKQRTQTGLHIKGDLDCAKALYDCTHQLDIDWEGHLAKGLGDNMAHALFTGFKETQQWAKQTVKDRSEDLGAYLQDEKDLLPTKAQVEAFYNDVNVLRHDVERFEATLNHLQQQVKK